MGCYACKRRGDYREVPWCEPCLRGRASNLKYRLSTLGVHRTKQWCYDVLVDTGYMIVSVSTLFARDMRNVEEAVARASAKAEAYDTTLTDEEETATALAV